MRHSSSWLFAALFVASQVQASVPGDSAVRPWSKPGDDFTYALIYSQAASELQEFLQNRGDTHIYCEKYTLGSECGFALGEYGHAQPVMFDREEDLPQSEQKSVTVDVNRRAGYATVIFTGGPAQALMQTLEKGRAMPTDPLSRHPLSFRGENIACAGEDANVSCAFRVTRAGAMIPLVPVIKAAPAKSGPKPARSK